MNDLNVYWDKLEIHPNPIICDCSFVRVFVCDIFFVWINIFLDSNVSIVWNVRLFVVFCINYLKRSEFSSFGVL